VVNKYSPQEIGEFIDTALPGCKFVGMVVGDGEVFLRFEEEDLPLQTSQKKVLRQMFPDLFKITTVVEPSIEQVTDMMNNLNILLDEDEAKPSSGLLDIEEF
jgi:hypothetical protein